MKKNVIITGTSTGVGLETAVLFVENGYKVYATMRNLDKAETLKSKMTAKGLAFELLSLDVTDKQSIDKAVAHIIQQDGKIDLLINNAGAGFAKTTEFSSEDEIRWVTEVNYLGTVFCTQAVIPHMRTAKSGHVINISSVGGLIGQPFNELYCGAKFAVEGFTEGLASYLTPAFNIHFTAVEPGGITTEFINSAAAKTMTDGQLAPAPYLELFQQYMAGRSNRSSEDTDPVYQTGLDVAKVILSVAENENPPLRMRTSKWAEAFCNFKTQTDPTGNLAVKMVQEAML